MSRCFQIAIDGPSGAGKSTVAKTVAKELGIDYIDTGAMYRAVGYKMMREKIPAEAGTRLNELLAQTELDFSNGKIFLDGEDVSNRIRTPEAAAMASAVSALPAVREKLVAEQRAMGQAKCVVMDGRDIGTNVFPHAEYKFFLTASVEARAYRRWLELRKKGTEVALEQVQTDLEQRDYNDSHRALNPLKKAEDAIEVDSTEMDPQAVVNFILNRIRKQ